VLLIIQGLQPCESTNYDYQLKNQLTMNVLNNIINNAKTSSSLNELNGQDVCISVQSNGREKLELFMSFDSAEIALIELNNEQAEHLIKMLQEHLKNQLT